MKLGFDLLVPEGLHYSNIIVFHMRMGMELLFKILLFVFFSLGNHHRLSRESIFALAYVLCVSYIDPLPIGYIMELDKNLLALNVLCLLVVDELDRGSMGALLYLEALMVFS